jgi:hypothetical protein
MAFDLSAVPPARVGRTGEPETDERPGIPDYYGKSVLIWFRGDGSVSLVHKVADKRAALQDAPAADQFLIAWARRPSGGQFVARVDDREAALSGLRPPSERRRERQQHDWQ